MTKRILAALLLAVLAALPAAPAADAAPASRARARTVIVVLAPHLRWDDVASGYMPATQSAARAGAVADMNVRCLLADAGEPNADQGALMLSAGTWARCDTSAPVAEQTPSGIRYGGLEAQRRANAGQAVRLEPGTLGQAVIDAGGVTAAIGNGDGAYPSRPAAIAAMDAEGRVRLGDVTSATVSRTRSPELPFGASDTSRISHELGSVLASVGSRPALIVLDPGDLSRAHQASGAGPDGLGQLGRVEALRHLDTVVADARSQLPRGGLLVIAGTVAAKPPEGPSGFGPLIVLGTAPGLLTSPSTHRDGLVTEADLTAGILAGLDLDTPGAVAGAPFTTRHTGGSPADRLADLQQIDSFMRAVDAVRPLFVERFIDVSVVLLALVALLLSLPSVPRAIVRVVQYALLAVAAVPAASVVMYAVLRRPQSPALVLCLFAATLFAVWTLAAGTHGTRRRSRAIAFVALLGALAMVVDQLAGAPYSLDGLLSYSPLVGARYFGIGNETAALLIGCALTGFALLFDFNTEQPWMKEMLRYGFPAAALIALVASAAPLFGANVGVAIWGTFAFGLAWWGMTGRKTTWKTVLILVLAVGLLLGSFALIDIAAPTGSRTHLAKAVGAASGDGGSLWLLLRRKVAMNVQMLVGTEWSLLFFALVAVLGYLRWRPPGTLRDLLVERPNFAAALTAALVAGAISYFTEDSGVVVPALLLLVPAVALTYLLLEHKAEARR